MVYFSVIKTLNIKLSPQNKFYLNKKEHTYLLNTRWLITKISINSSFRKREYLYDLFSKLDQQNPKQNPINNPGYLPTPSPTEHMVIIKVYKIIKI